MKSLKKIKKVTTVLFNYVLMQSLFIVLITVI